MSIESWDDPPSPDRYEPAADEVRCYHCGKPCSGDTTETVETPCGDCEVYVCDPTDEDGSGCKGEQ